MSDSSTPEGPAESGDERRTRRIRRAKRWVEYIESTPAAEWGPQQNRVVDSQLEAAREAGISATHHRRVERAAERRADEGNE